MPGRAGPSGGEPDTGPGPREPGPARARHPRGGDDLLISKYVAGREKDRDYARSAARHRLADPQTLLQRLALTPVDEAQRRRITAQVHADFQDP